MCQSFMDSNSIYVGHIYSVYTLLAVVAIVILAPVCTQKKTQIAFCRSWAC